MKNTDLLEIFLATVPGLEAPLRAEAVEKGFKKPTITPGGITVKGDWQTVWRANLEMRGASKVLVRLGAFRVSHLSQLDKRARQFPWAETLRADVPVRVEVTCKKSKIYHQKAAAERLEKAITEELGAPLAEDAPVCIRARIDHDLCTLSVDTSGELLHKRGHKEAVNKAPMRENLAALLLRQAGYNGKEPVLDPMCGSGTFVIEAAEIAARLNPGRSRAFAFEHLIPFDPEVWQAMQGRISDYRPNLTFTGSDRDAGAIRISQANAARAGIESLTRFDNLAVSDLVRPDGPAGLVIVNPPYGERIGEVKKLSPLYRTLGEKLRSDFQGWRVALVTAAPDLAKATGLPWQDEATSFSHGGIRVTLYTTAPLG